MSSLIQGIDGNLYGTTTEADSKGWGTVFKIAVDNHLTSVSFCPEPPGCVGGRNPVSRLLQATDGNFYGTTTAGGIGGVSDCSGIGCGTVFRLSATGTLTTLYNFCSQVNCADGSQPTAGLIQADRWQSVWHNLSGRLRLRHGIQNYPHGHADHVVQF